MSWGAIAVAAVSVGAGAASSAIKNSSAKGGEMGYDLPMLTNAPWDATNQQLTSRMGQNMALNAMQGRLSPGQETMLDRIKKYQLAQSKEAMFGRPGQRGDSIMGVVDSRSSRSGVGPKAFMAQGSKALQDYASRDSQIMNYIDSLKFSGLQSNEKTSANMMQSMPRSNEIPYSGQVQRMNTPAQPGFDTGLQNVDWFNAMKGFGGGTKTQTWPENQVIPQQPQYKPLSGAEADSYYF